jgi:hypothetical protein
MAVSQRQRAGVKPNQRRAAIVAPEVKMHINTKSAAKRRTIASRNSMALRDMRAQQMPVPAMLSTIELRQLVAAMVD